MKIFLLFTFNLVFITNNLVNVTHLSSNTLVILDSKLVSKDNNKRKQICQPESQFLNSKQQVYLIQALKQFKVHAFTKDIKLLVVTGISRSIYNQANNLYESEIVIMSKCNPQNEVINYKLYLNVSMENEQFIPDPIPIKLVCYIFNNFSKFQYVLLQFMMATLFLFTNILFIHVNATVHRFLDPIILIVLALSVFHKLFSLMFNLFCIMRLLHACFANFTAAIPNRIQRTIAFHVTISVSIMYGIKSAESSVLWIHYFENFLAIIGIGSILKITRLRYLFLLWLTLYFFYDPFISLTQNHPDLQFYFPALSPLKPYSCVSINILELALPLVFSIFFVRFSERFSYNKKMYLMFNFMSYLMINVFTSILILKDNRYRLTAMVNINTMIFLGIFLSILENNFTKLSTFRLN